MLTLGAAFEFGFWLKTIKSRIILVLAGPLAFLFLSVIGEIRGEGLDRLPGIRHARAVIEKETEGKRFSFLQIAHRLIEMLILFAILGKIYLAYRHW